MTAAELREKIQILAKQVYADTVKADDAALAYPEIQKFPPLKDIIMALKKQKGGKKKLEPVDYAVATDRAKKLAEKNEK